MAIPAFISPFFLANHPLLCYHPFLFSFPFPAECAKLQRPPPEDKQDRPPPSTTNTASYHQKPATGERTTWQPTANSAQFSQSSMHAPQSTTLNTGLIEVAGRERRQGYLNLQKPSSPFLPGTHAHTSKVLRTYNNDRFFSCRRGSRIEVCHLAAITHLIQLVALSLKKVRTNKST